MGKLIFWRQKGVSWIVAGCYGEDFCSKNRASGGQVAGFGADYFFKNKSKNLLDFLLILVYSVAVFGIEQVPDDVSGSFPLGKIQDYLIYC